MKEMHCGGKTQREEKMRKNNLDLEIEMDDLLSVDVADPLQDLLGEDAASLLREHKLVLNHPVKKLPASDAAIGAIKIY